MYKAAQFEKNVNALKHIPQIIYIQISSNIHFHLLFYEYCEFRFFYFHISVFHIQTQTLWVSNLIPHSTGLFKNTDSFKNKKTSDWLKAKLHTTILILLFLLYI